MNNVSRQTPDIMTKSSNVMTEPKYPHLPRRRDKEAAGLHPHPAPRASGATDLSPFGIKATLSISTANRARPGEKGALRSATPAPWPPSLSLCLSLCLRLSLLLSLFLSLPLSFSFSFSASLLSLSLSRSRSNLNTSDIFLPKAASFGAP